MSAKHPELERGSRMRLFETNENEGYPRFPAPPNNAAKMPHCKIYKTLWVELNGCRCGDGWNPHGMRPRLQPFAPSLTGSCTHPHPPIWAHDYILPSRPTRCGSHPLPRSQTYGRGGRLNFSPVSPPPHLTKENRLVVHCYYCVWPMVLRTTTS